MEELQERIQALAKRLGADGPVRPEDISEAIGCVVDEPVNCYPGEPGGRCCPVAFFVSLRGPKYAAPRVRGHLDFGQALARMVQHMQGHCPGTTRLAVLLTDSVDPAALDEWRDNIIEIRKSGARVEAFLLQGPGNDAVCLSV